MATSSTVANVASACALNSASRSTGSSCPRSGITPFGERAMRSSTPLMRGALRAGDPEGAADRAEDFVAGAGRAHLPAPLRCFHWLWNVVALRRGEIAVIGPAAGQRQGLEAALVAAEPGRDAFMAMLVASR